MKSAQYLGTDDTHLINVENHRAHFLTEKTHSALIKMCSAATQDNIDISIASSYRSFDRQTHIWNSKWRGERPLFDRKGIAIDVASLSDEEKVFAILNWSALPGTSRHHWGTDIDVYDAKACRQRHHTLTLVPEEYSLNGPCHSLHTWLSTHANEYGFFFPYTDKSGGYAPEPWHISYREQALVIEQGFDIDALSNVLERSNILGLSTIIKQLSVIVERFVYINSMGDRGYE